MMKIKPNELAFDIDGVFADTIGAFIREARDRYGIIIRYEDITEYELMKSIKMDENTMIELAKRILYEPLEMGISPIEGSVRVLKKLSQTTRLLFVTARPDREGISKWVLSHLRDVDRDRIWIMATGTHEQKVPLLASQGIRYFVEDRLETCFMLAQASITPIVFEQPWNKKTHPFPSIKGWHELEQMIDWNHGTSPAILDNTRI